jgi:hypothetical protein
MFIVLTSAIIGWGCCPFDKRTFYHKIILKERWTDCKYIRDFFFLSVRNSMYQINNGGGIKKMWSYQTIRQFMVDKN